MRWRGGRGTAPPPAPGGGRASPHRSPRLGLLAGWALLAPAVALAYPIPREGAEARVAWAEPLLELGTWTRDGEKLRHVPGEHRRSFIISKTPTRGFARLRIQRTDAADVAAALIFRTRVAETSPLRLEGYGLAVSSRKGTLSFYRWDKAGRQDPGARVELPALEAVAELEVVLWMAGPNFSATVYDAFSKEPIGSLSWSDPSYAEGNLGLFAFERTGAGVAMELWAEATAPRHGTAAPTEVSKRWLVVLTPEQVLEIPAPLVELYERREVTGIDGVPLITDERGLHLLRERGLEPLRVQAGLPFAATRAPNEELLDPAGVEAALRSLATRFPRRARLFEVGKSAGGRVIWGLRVASDPTDQGRPTLLLSGGIHANEASTPSYVIDAATFLLERRRDPVVRPWLEGLALVAVPLMNPDGSHAFWHLDAAVGRKSRREVVPGLRNPGVDLNRNYPFEWGGPATRYNSDDPASNFYFGPAAGSEPEVQAMMRLAGDQRFVAMIAFHSSATRLIVPYTTPGIDSPEPSVAWAVANGMMERLTHDFGRRRYEAVSSIYAVRGSEKDWYHHAFGTVAYVLEVPFRRPRGPRLNEAVTHTRPAWQYLLERWLAGPSLSVRALRRSSRTPLEAVVTLDEIELRAGERWTTNPRSGWLHHYLPAPGRYTLRLERDGQVRTRRVDVTGGVARVVVLFDEPALADDTESPEVAEEQMAQ